MNTIEHLVRLTSMSSVQETMAQVKNFPRELEQQTEVVTMTCIIQQAAALYTGYISPSVDPTVL